MKHSFSRFVATALLAATCAVAAAATAPDALVRSVVEEVLGVIKQNNDQKTLRTLAEQKVLPYFDFNQMTQMAAGKAWRDATPEQKKALENGFRALLVNTYTSSLSRTSGGDKTVDVKPLPASAAKGEVLVKTIVRQAGRPPFAIDYRMEDASGDWKVVDVTIENVSLVANYRGTFASEISRSGIDGLIKALEAKNQGAARS
ncbi:MAG: ABC transporter substrate-binding protein [Proteobacteria bacterium]|nr:ABC transporter substrate-binding protein [Pseudomonadota bacterium]